MANDNGSFMAECRDQPYDIIDDLNLIVAFNFCWFIAFTIATHIRCNDVISRCCQWSKLVSPRIPGFRESVNQQDQRALTLFCNVEFDAIGGNSSLPNVTHLASSILAGNDLATMVFGIPG